MSIKHDPVHVDLIVKSALESWTSLRLAIQHGFVEGNSEEKFSALTEDLKDLCLQGSDQLDIEELLESSAYHDFNFLDEDGSFKDLAKAIVTSLNELQTEALNQVITKHFPSVSEALKKSVMGEDKTVEVEEGAALSEMISETSIQEQSAESYLNSVKQKQEPIIDEDGFQLVQSRRKR